MKCASCGHVNPDGSRFCLECGAHFAARCPSCGVELPPTAKFCNVCGAPRALFCTGRGAPGRLERDPPNRVSDFPALGPKAGAHAPAALREKLIANYADFAARDRAALDTLQRPAATGPTDTHRRNPFPAAEQHRRRTTAPAPVLTTRCQACPVPSRHRSGTRATPRSTNGIPSPPPRWRASARKVSRCSRTTPCSTPCSG